MQISPDYSKLAFTVITNDDNDVELYDFDNATGIVSNPMTLENDRSWNSYKIWDNILSHIFN